jgi:hypothetical protein
VVRRGRKRKRSRAMLAADLEEKEKAPLLDGELEWWRKSSKFMPTFKYRTDLKLKIIFKSSLKLAFFFLLITGFKGIFKADY